MARPAIKMRRRPNRSESGPQKSCAPAYPTRNRLSVSCTLCGLVLKLLVMVGSDGRLMSTASAVMPASAPSSTVRPQDWGFSMSIRRSASGVLEAQNAAVVVVSEELRIARPVHHGLEHFARVLLAQMVFELAEEPGAGRGMAGPLVEHAPDMCDQRHRAQQVLGEELL